jgi:hypothetical protein
MKDGVVPSAVATGLLRVADDDLERLVSVRFLDVADGGYQVHDFLSYNPSREQIVTEREAKRQGGRDGAARRWHRDSSTHGSSHGGSHADPIGGSMLPIPIPSRPDPKEERESSPRLAPPERRVVGAKTKAARRAKSYVPASDAPTADVDAWCQMNGIPSPSKSLEASKMLDHFRAAGEAKADWGATWRNWERRAPQFAKPGEMQPSQSPSRAKIRPLSGTDYQKVPTAEEREATKAAAEEAVAKFQKEFGRPQLAA